MCALPWWQTLPLWKGGCASEQPRPCWRWCSGGSSGSSPWQRRQAADWRAAGGGASSWTAGRALRRQTGRERQTRLTSVYVILKWLKLKLLKCGWSSVVRYLRYIYYYYLYWPFHLLKEKHEWKSANNVIIKVFFLLFYIRICIFMGLKDIHYNQTTVHSFSGNFFINLHQV